MRSKDKRHTRAALAVLAALSMGSPHANAQGDDEGDADTRSLHGEYGFTTTQTCVRTPFQRPPAAGIDVNTRQLLVNGEAINAVGLGVLRFAKDGTVGIEGGVLTEVALNQLSAGQAPLSVGTQFTCSGNYVAQPDNRLSVTLACNVVTPQPGLSVALAPFEFEGFVGRGRRSINLSSVKASLQTVTVSVGGNPVQQRHRLCVQSLSGDKL